MPLNPRRLRASLIVWATIETASPKQSSFCSTQHMRPWVLCAVRISPIQERNWTWFQWRFTGIFCGPEMMMFKESFKKICICLSLKKLKAACTYLLGECKASADRFLCDAHSEWKVHHWKYKCSVRKEYYYESGKGCMWDVHFWRRTKFKKSLNNLLYLRLLCANELWAFKFPSNLCDFMILWLKDADFESEIIRGILEL